MYYNFSGFPESWQSNYFRFKLLLHSIIGYTGYAFQVLWQASWPATFQPGQPARHSGIPWHSGILAF